MMRDEPHGKDDDGDKKLPFKCCSCRSTREHRCYKCFCGKCPGHTKTVPPRYGVKDRFPDSRASNSSSKLGRSKETIVSGQTRRTDTSPKQKPVETSDPHSGDKHRPGFSSNPSTMRSWPSIRIGTRANGAEDKCSKAISPNSFAESGSSSRPSIENEQRGNDEVGNQKITTNEVDGVSSKAHAGFSSNWDALAEKKLQGNDAVGNQKVTTNAVEGGSFKSHDGSSSIWDALVGKKQRGWANKAGSASSWGTWRVNESRDKAAGTASSWSTWHVKEPREKDEVGNQKVTTSEVEGGSSKSHDVSSSNWDALAEKALKGNETGWANKAGFASNWTAWSVNGSRGNREVMANRAQARSSKPVSLWPQVESGSRWTSYTGKRSGGDQERRTNRIEDASSRPWKKPRGRHEIVAYTNKQGSSEPGQLRPHVESGSSRASFTVKESRGKQEVKDSWDEGGSYKSVSHSTPSGSNSSWDAYIVKDSRDNAYSISRNQEAMANKAKDEPSREALNPHKPVVNLHAQLETRGDAHENTGRLYKDCYLWNPEATTCRPLDISSQQVLHSHHAQPGSSWDILTVKEPSGNANGNQEIITYRAEHGSSVPVLHNPNAGFISTTSLHNPEETIYRAGDGSSKQVLLNHHAQAGSNWDSLTGKKPNGNQEIMAYRAENGSSIPVLHKPNAGLVSIPPSLHNPEETIYRAEDGSSKQVLHNHHAQSGSSGDALTVKEPSGNQEIMGYRAENGSFLPVLSSNAGFVSTPPSLTSKEPTGRSISEKESVKDGQHDVTILSKKLEGIVNADKKFTHPAVASLCYAKPPPSALSGKSFSSQNLVQVGPASRVLWTGHIELPDADNRMFEVFLAHSAAKVSRKAYKFAAQMADVLQFKIHPRRAFWPKIFQLGCPDARDVALYFYPERSDGSKQKYRGLLKLLEQQDLMLRSVMGQVELLVFSSKLLRSKYQVLNGCIFMWGVFHKFGSNEVSCSAEALLDPRLESAQAIANAT